MIMHTLFCIDGNSLMKIALTPELGLELAHAYKPDLILLDINMPNMDEIQVLEIFKADASLKNTPVIAITANAMSHDFE